MAEELGHRLLEEVQRQLREIERPTHLLIDPDLFVVLDGYIRRRSMYLAPYQHIYGLEIVKQTGALDVVRRDRND